jgi:nitrite reductase (NO-forming)
LGHWVPVRLVNDFRYREALRECSRRSCWVAALRDAAVWGTAEGFGGPYTSSSTDIGTAVIYAVVFMGLLALNYEAGPSRFSVDYLIEQRVSWWHRIAEIGPRAKDATSPADATPPARTTAIPVASAPVAT